MSDAHKPSKQRLGDLAFLIAAFVLTLVCLDGVHCSESDTVVDKHYSPARAGGKRGLFGGGPSPERWSLTVKKPDGSESYVFVDQITYHKYDVGDRYP